MVPHTVHGLRTRLCQDRPAPQLPVLRRPVRHLLRARHARQDGQAHEACAREGAQARHRRRRAGAAQAAQQPATNHRHCCCPFRAPEPKSAIPVQYFLSINFIQAAESGGMPQLDPEFWYSQIFWLIITFGILYLILSKFIFLRFLISSISWWKFTSITTEKFECYKDNIFSEYYNYRSRYK